MKSVYKSVLGGVIVALLCSVSSQLYAWSWLEVGCGLVAGPAAAAACHEAEEGNAAGSEAALSECREDLQVCQEERDAFQAQDESTYEAFNEMYLECRSERSELRDQLEELQGKVSDACALLDTFPFGEIAKEEANSIIRTVREQLGCPMHISGVVDYQMTDAERQSLATQAQWQIKDKK